MKEIEWRFDMNDNCIFCKIVNGEIPSRQVYEDDLFRVIMDVAPATKGHMLVLTKKHFRNIFDLADLEASKMFALAKRIAIVLQESLKCDGINIVQNNEAVAGQSVFHFHLHIIPRYENDGQNMLWTPGTPAAEELESIAATISKALAAG